MKREKWYKYKNRETGHVIHSPILPEDMTFELFDAGGEYVDSIPMKLTRR